MIQGIKNKILNSERLSFEDGVALFERSNILEIGLLANAVRFQKHPKRRVTYVAGRNINYTNVCWIRCRFCAFYRLPKHEEGYVLSEEVILQKVEEMVKAGGIEILMQGGLHPQLKIDYFENLFRTIKTRFSVILHALSPTEIIHIARLSRLSLEETIRRLVNAGLDSIPGGGGELLVDAVRQHISPYKDSADQWLNVMRIAHKLGLRTTATMTIGLGETVRQRVEHLIRVRELQDETSGFTAFIPWDFQPTGTDLGKELGDKKVSGFDYLRTIAIARLMLDNFDNIQASYVTQGAKIAQLALSFGVNDFGSTMMEENVVRAAGTQNLIPVTQIQRLIQNAGFTPVKRNTRYEILENKFDSQVIKAS